MPSLRADLTSLASVYRQYQSDLRPQSFSRITASGTLTNACTASKKRVPTPIVGLVQGTDRAFYGTPLGGGSLDLRDLQPICGSVRCETAVRHRGKHHRDLGGPMWLAQPRSDVMLSHRDKRSVENSVRVLFPEPFGLQGVIYLPAQGPAWVSQCSHQCTGRARSSARLLQRWRRRDLKLLLSRLQSESRRKRRVVISQIESFHLVVIQGVEIQIGVPETRLRGRAYLNAGARPARGSRGAAIHSVTGHSHASVEAVHEILVE